MGWERPAGKCMLGPAPWFLASGSSPASCPQSSSARTLASVSPCVTQDLGLGGSELQTQQELEQVRPWGSPKWPRSCELCWPLVPSPGSSAGTGEDGETLGGIRWSGSVKRRKGHRTGQLLWHPAIPLLPLHGKICDRKGSGIPTARAGYSQWPKDRRGPSVRPWTTGQANAFRHASGHGSASLRKEKSLTPNTTQVHSAK